MRSKVKVQRLLSTYHRELLQAMGMRCVCMRAMQDVVRGMDRTEMRWMVDEDVARRSIACAMLMLRCIRVVYGRDCRKNHDMRSGSTR